MWKYRYESCIGVTIGQYIMNEKMNETRNELVINNYNKSLMKKNLFALGIKSLNSEEAKVIIDK